MTAIRPFLDTNVFLYGLDRVDVRKSKVADNLIHDTLLAENGVISYQVVQEFISVALKKFPTVMSVNELGDYLSKVFQRFDIVGSSVELVQNALDLHKRYQLS